MNGMHFHPFHHKAIRIGPYSTSKQEIIDLFKAWLAISLAFSIVREGLHFEIHFLWVLIMSAITVGVAFLLHELAHKIAAQHYGCFAEFRCINHMLILGVLLSFFGLIFFAPGAVLIAGPVGKRRNGIISAAGPATNFALAILFLISLFYIGGAMTEILTFGYYINTWLGLFNMIPFWIFDGKKIITWNKAVYWGMVALGLVLLFSQGLISGLIG